jgi:hypothetical protein
MNYYVEAFSFILGKQVPRLLVCNFENSARRQSAEFQKLSCSLVTHRTHFISRHYLFPRNEVRVSSSASPPHTSLTPLPFLLSARKEIKGKRSQALVARRK